MPASVIVRRTGAILFLLVAVACGDSVTQPRASRTIFRPDATVIATSEAVKDAANRATRGLADAALAATLREQLLTLAAGLDARSAEQTRVALSAVDVTLAGSEGSAPPNDMPDRDVIKLALEQVRRVLA